MPSAISEPHARQVASPTMSQTLLILGAPATGGFVSACLAITLAVFLGRGNGPAEVSKYADVPW